MGMSDDWTEGQLIGEIFPGKKNNRSKVKSQFWSKECHYLYLLRNRFSLDSVTLDDENENNKLSTKMQLRHFHNIHTGTFIILASTDKRIGK